MELIEQIREKCIEANPDIMAMRLGTRLYHPKHDKFLRYVGKNNNQYALLVEDSEVMLLVDRFTDCETIGRDIRLADVLLAIADHPAKFVMWPDGDTFEEAGPHLVMSLKDDNSDESIGSWGLLQDDLIKQSPETLAFIGKVLGITS